MGKTVSPAKGVERKSLKPLSPVEILAREGLLSQSDDTFAALEEQFSEPAPPVRSRRSRTKAGELDAYAEARPLTREEIAAKEAAAELRNPKLIATHDGRFVIPKPPEKVQPAIPPAPTTTWD